MEGRTLSSTPDPSLAETPAGLAARLDRFLTERGDPLSAAKLPGTAVSNPSIDGQPDGLPLAAARLPLRRPVVWIRESPPAVTRCRGSHLLGHADALGDAYREKVEASPVESATSITELTLPPPRPAGRVFETVGELVEALKTDAKVL